MLFNFFFFPPAEFFWLDKPTQQKERQEKKELFICMFYISNIVFRLFKQVPDLTTSFWTMSQLEPISLPTTSKSVLLWNFLPSKSYKIEPLSAASQCFRAFATAGYSKWICMGSNLCFHPYKGLYIFLEFSYHYFHVYFFTWGPYLPSHIHLLHIAKIFKGW